jgi:hypothetical protein
MIRKNDYDYCVAHSSADLLSLDAFLETDYGSVLILDIKNEICRYILR